MKKLSVQMWSLKDYAEKDLDSALVAVKAAGFDGVELAGMYGLTAAELKGKLDKHGLKASGAHIGLDNFSNFEQLAADAKVLGYADIIVPSLDVQKLYSDTDAIVAGLNQAAQKCKAAGLRLGYHNHEFEFKDGINYLYVFADGVKDMLFEVDVFWLKAAEQDYFEIYKRLGSRINILHIKEMNPKGIWEPNPVPGEGVARIGEILAHAKDKGAIEWLVLEAENLKNTDYKEYLKKSAQYIKKQIA